MILSATVMFIGIILVIYGVISMPLLFLCAGIAFLIDCTVLAMVEQNMVNRNE